MSRSAGDLLPRPWSARSRVHEYGGLSWAGVEHLGDRCLVFVEASDQRLYLLGPSGLPQPLTGPSDGKVRFAEPVPLGGEVWCVREVHHPGGVSRSLVSIDLITTVLTVRDSASQFYSNITPSRDGHHVAWIAWNAPQMPWDGTEVVVARVVPGGMVERRVLAGSRDESVTDVVWKNATSLYFISDAAGWWNLWEVGLDGSVSPVVADECDWGAPKWEVGARSLFRMADGRLLAFHQVDEVQKPAVVDPIAGTITDVASTMTEWRPTGSAHGFSGYCVARGPAANGAIMRLNVGDLPTADVLAHLPLPLPAAFFAEPRMTALNVDGHVVHAVVHPAHNPGVIAAGDEVPPLLISVHGGPTGHAVPALDLRHAYFTSRGFTVADINYAGSSGFGRDYREALRGNWGVADVADVVGAARALVASGLAEPKRIVISGGSAGGFTVLNALMSSDLFAAGASYFGIADLEELVAHMHDFEAHYFEGLIGPYPASRDLYRERSPLSRAGALTSPLIIFQGLNDPIVPPAQAELLLEACRRNGIDHEYVAFEGEGHGFRGAEAIAESLERELAFYGRILGFEPRF